MALEKITEAQMDAKGVISAPNILNGSAAANKAIFDRMVRELVAPAYNKCVDAVNALESTEQGVAAAEAERKKAETAREEAEAARENKETGYVARAEAAAVSAEEDAEAAAKSAAAAKTSEINAKESENRAAQAVLGQIPDGSLEPVKFSGSSRSMMVRENLLDNSHFYAGALVDQRGGYVVPPGVNYYESTEGGTAAGTTDSYVKVTPTPNVANSGMLTIGGTTYYCAWSKAVRGYTGAGYGIDRWYRYGNGGATLITDDGIQIINDGTTTTGVIQKKPAAELEARRTYTLSALVKVVEDESVQTANNIALSYGNSNDGNSGSFWVPRLANGSDFELISYTFTLPESTDGLYNFRIRSQAVAKISYIVKGMKLELGTEQTLAHQENGKWVLNEIPNYAETLAKCQRYQFKLDSKTGTNVFGTSYAKGEASAMCFVPTPVSMRANSTVTFENVGLYGVGGESFSAARKVSSITDAIKAENGIRFAAAASNLTTGSTYLVVGKSNTYILFDANL